MIRGHILKMYENSKKAKLQHQNIYKKGPK